MITFKEAEKIALNRINADYTLISEAILEKPYGWHFCFQSKKYLETGNISDMAVGSGGLLVEKENGKVVEFGSAFSTEQNFKIYEKGLCSRCDLVILKVREPNKAIRLLKRLQMINIESKSGSKSALGVRLQVPAIYNEKQLKEAISKLPFTFKNQNFYFRFDEFEKIDDSKCFDYEIKKS